MAEFIHKGRDNKLVYRPIIARYKLTEADKKEYKHNYYLKNIEVYQDRNYKYFYANRDKILEKNKTRIQCMCGCEISHINISRHKRSKFHIEFTQ